MSHATDLAPTCDRCAKPPEFGGIMTKELRFVCFDCLTHDEMMRLKERVESPGILDDDEDDNA